MKNQDQYTIINKKIAEETGLPVEFVQKFRSGFFSEPYKGNLGRYQTSLENKVKIFDDTLQSLKNALEKMRAKPKSPEQEKKINAVLASMEGLQENNSYRVQALRYLKTAPAKELRILLQHQT